MIILDCQLTPSVQVSTSNGSYVITKNHTIVTMEFSELINFTVAVNPIDPYFICKRLHFSWYFGDGCNASGNHTEHRYNKAGLYGVVLKIYKVFNSDNGMELMSNVTMTIHILKGLLLICNKFRVSGPTPMEHVRKWVGGDVDKKQIFSNFCLKFTQPKIPQTCCELSILLACYNLSFADLLQLVETTCSKLVANKFGQLTCNRLVVNKL